MIRAAVAANDNRPASFDARLMSYMPGLRKYACRLSNNDMSRADDLVNETVRFALEKWENFRGDPSLPKSGFYAWLRLNMFAIWQLNDRSARRRAESPIYEEAFAIGTPATQEVVTSCRRLVSSLLESRDGSMMVACAMGETLEETGLAFGVSRERVRQLIGVRRKALGRIPANDTGFVFARKAKIPRTEF